MAYKTLLGLVFALFKLLHVSLKSGKCQAMWLQRSRLASEL